MTIPYLGSRCREYCQVMLKALKEAFSDVLMGITLREILQDQLYMGYICSVQLTFMDDWGKFSLIVLPPNKEKQLGQQVRITLLKWVIAMNFMQIPIQFQCVSLCVCICIEGKNCRLAIALIQLMELTLLIKCVQYMQVIYLFFMRLLLAQLKEISSPCSIICNKVSEEINSHKSEQKIR